MEYTSGKLVMLQVKKLTVVGFPIPVDNVSVCFQIVSFISALCDSMRSTPVKCVMIVSPL